MKQKKFNFYNRYVNFTYLTTPNQSPSHYYTSGITGPQTITVDAFYYFGSPTSSIVVKGAPATPTITPATICAGTDELYFASSSGADSYSWATTCADYEECTNSNCSQYYVIWNATGGSRSVTA